MLLSLRKNDLTSLSLRLLNALNSEDRGLKVRFSLATIAFHIESAQMSQILSSQGKNAPSNPYPHYLVRLATSRIRRLGRFQGSQNLSLGAHLRGRTTTPTQKAQRGISMPLKCRAMTLTAGGIFERGSQALS